mmetsp:Transcript_125359/g.297598  ORF Transcript_125359/g.297598 Transcript_125359/m.297598 type:complete len:367 (+) Transcript_125359:37-1137(+)
MSMLALWGYLVPSWTFGVFLCVLSNALTALGLVTQKLAHLKSEQSSKPRSYFKQPWWIAGMTAFLVGQAANIPAMALTPQTMLSCLGGLSLVFNSTYAHFLLGERVRAPEVLVMVAMITGAALVVSVTPVSHQRYVTAGQIFGYVLHKTFLLTALAVTVGLTMLGIVASVVAPVLKPFFLGLTCAACGSYGMTLFKVGAEVVGKTEHWWLNVELYVLAIFALAVCVIQVHTLNLGLRHGEVVTIIPTFFALGVLFSLFQAEMAFGELNDLGGATHIVMFVAGVVLVIGSTLALLLLQRDEEEEIVKIADAQDEERVPLLHDRRTNSEPTLRRNSWSISHLSMVPNKSFDSVQEFTLLSVTGPMGVA